MVSALREHWPEYLIEAWGLATFMAAAGVVATVLWYPEWPVRDLIGGELGRRLVMGLAMGLTAIGIIYSPWGQRSGAHLNPAVTLSFLRLGKVRPADAAFYVLAQFVGGLVGVLVAWAIVGIAFEDLSVRFVVTVPGEPGVVAAVIAEAVMAGGLMLMVLVTSNHARLSRFTGLFAGLLLWSYISIAAPFSGMSINPARTVASAIPAGVYDHLWVYFVATIGGMVVVAELYRRLPSAVVYCAKLNHHGGQRCIFHCRFNQLLRRAGLEPREHEHV